MCSARGCGGFPAGRPALLLDFAPLGAPLEPRPVPGTAFEAELAFHPGSVPLRAVIAGELDAVEPAPGAFGGGGVGEALRSVATALAANPWLDEWPVVLRDAIPDGRDGGDWIASTADGALPLGGPIDARWRLLAVSGGRPVSLFGLWNGTSLTPLAAGDGDPDGGPVTAFDRPHGRRTPSRTTLDGARTVPLDGVRGSPRAAGGRGRDRAGLGAGLAGRLPRAGPGRGARRALESSSGARIGASGSRAATAPSSPARAGSRAIAASCRRRGRERLRPAASAGTAASGRRVLAAGLDELRSQSGDHATLWVFAENHPARAFYARFGFLPDGAEGVDDGTGLDEIRLRVRL